ncbi:MAG: AraC family transcriptional regulator [Oscillospiraceae bacterium]|nr:AraC family transcriptional regulator [Oscillospiraceae bacterium]
MKDFTLSDFTDNSTFPFHIQYDRHEKSFPIHRHLDFTELVVVMNGSASHIVNNEPYPVRKGDVFVVGRDVSHGFTDASGLEICNIMFRPENAFSENSDIRSMPGFRSLFIITPGHAAIHGYINRLSLAPEDYHRVFELIRTITGEYESSRDGRESMLNSCFTMLAVTLSRLNDPSSDEAKRNIINVANTAAYIERHYTEKLSLEELAEMSHYSARHFVRIFKETYNTTPQKYITSLRLKHACALLRETELSIEDAALQSGFGDGNYFSRIFRSSMGVSPKQYRKNHRPS